MRGLPFEEDSNQPVSDLSKGRYIICKTRAIVQIDDGFFPGSPDDNWTLDIDTLDDGFEFSAVVTIPGVKCGLRGLGIPDKGPDANCPDIPAIGETILTYYFIATQSFLPEKKNEITFDSHYATYLTADGTQEDIATLGDKETTVMHIVVEGNQLFSDDAYFQENSQFVYARNNAIVWAKEEDGCPE